MPDINLEQLINEVTAESINESKNIIEVSFEGFVNGFISRNITISTAENSEFVFIKFFNKEDEMPNPLISTISMTKKQYEEFAKKLTDFAFSTFGPSSNKKVIHG